MPEVIFVQDHLVQRGGAERGLLSMLKAAPGAAVHVAFYRPEQCYPEFAEVDVRPFPLDRIGPLSRRHRLAMPLLAPAFSSHRVDADVVICGTSGWAQGVRTTGRKVVYFYALTRWLYERDAYLGARGPLARFGVAALAPLLERWDRRTVASGHRFLTEGTEMRDRLREIYGIEAEIVPLPMALDAAGAQRPVDGLEPGFFLCASRLMPYKNIDVVLEAFARLPEQRLVVAGDGPEETRLRAIAPRNATMFGLAQDDQLRWLYANCAAVVTAAFEPFGLTPIEGAAYGKPTVALRAGGFIDTVIDGRTG
ncbi:MAG: glycosyltransferase, partial [Actinomycetota bacterium]